jgi:magnesium-transporting ATPase (P-type)
VNEPTYWHTLELATVADRLETDPRLGLSRDEAASRLQRYGPNRLEREPAMAWWRLVLHQFTDPLIYILMLAAVITLIIGDLADTLVILAVLVINAVIGFTQEFRAIRAMEALTQLSAPHAMVVRDGKVREIASEDVVPGDVVQLSSGDFVPADVRLVSVRDLEIDESLLSGESVPVRKKIDRLETELLVPGDRINLAFSGSTVSRGRGHGIVFATATDTELGRIAEAVRGVGIRRTPIQEKVDRLGHAIGAGIGGLSIVVIAIGLLRGMPLAEIVITAVALAVAAIPEALPVVLTVTLAVGVRRMSQRNAIIRSLPAVETLGSTTVVASDKTGTLTRNEMTVRAAWAAGRQYAVSGGGYDMAGEWAFDGEPIPDGEAPALQRTLLVAALASEADPPQADEPPTGDPTEIALLIAAEKAGIQVAAAREQHERIDMLPFESERRLMATLDHTDDGPMLHVKGAPEALLPRCSGMLLPDGETGELDAATVRAAARAFADQGYRVLAMAFRPLDADRLDAEAVDTGLTLAGLQALEDPVRPEAIEAVAAARRAGVRVLMLTGDHAGTALAIGRQLGLDAEEALEGAELEALSDDDLDQRLRQTSIYARVAPEHKLRIVERLRAMDEIVAVTGDGVNDSPALRAAHLGVAMGRKGTDAAREASDMVLADDNFATITAAVEEGRVVFANIRKVTYFLLSSAVGLVVTILAALIAGWPLPYIAVQVLWLNVVTNGLQDVALAFEPKEPGLLNDRPRPVHEGVISLPVLYRMLGIGAYMGVATLLVFLWALQQGYVIEHARSIAMTQMVVFNFFHVLNSRSMHRSVLVIGLFTNRFLFFSVVAAAFAQAAVLYAPPLQRLFQTAPLAPSDLVVIGFVGLTIILVAELDKLRVRRAHG